VEEGIYNEVSNGILVRQATQMRFVEQNFSFAFSERHVQCRNQTDTEGRFTEMAFPMWFGDVEIIREGTLNNDFLSLFHCSTEPCEVKDYNDIVAFEEKSLALNYGLRFIKCTLPTVKEAINRALVVAVLTYNLRKGVFVRLYPESTLS